MSYIEENGLQHDFAICIKEWDDLGEEGIFKLLKEPEAKPLIFWHSKEWAKEVNGDGFMLMTHDAEPEVTTYMVPENTQRKIDDWVKVAEVDLADNGKVDVKELF